MGGATSQDPRDMSNKVWNLVIIFVGMIVLIIHVLLFSFNKDVFNIIISLYIIAFTILFLVFLNKKKAYTSSTEYNFLSYTSLFVLGLEVLILALSVLSLFGVGKGSSSSTSGYGYEKYGRGGSRSLA